jgi:transposase
MENKKGGGLALPRNGKRYDKRTIVSIVESIEAGKPRHEVTKEYGVSSTSLFRWLVRYGTDVYHSSKPQVYKQSQKRSVVRAVRSGMSMKEAQVAFGIRHIQSIETWVKKAKAEKADLSRDQLIIMAKKEVNTDNEELKALQTALSEAQLKIKALDTLIDLAEEQLKINIRKKSGARQSAK